MKIDGNIITADEGKWLTNGQTYSQKVWLGVNDSPSNWSEVDDAPDEYKNDALEEEHKEEEILEVD